MAATCSLTVVCGLATFAWGEELPLGLLIAGAPLAVAVAWLFPVELALLFAAVTMFRIHEAYQFLMPLRLPLLAASLAMLSCALHMVSGKVSLPDRSELKLALLFFAHVTIGCVFSANIDQSFGIWSDGVVKLLVAMMFLAMILVVPRDAGKVAFALVAGSVLISCVAIYNQFMGLELVEGSRVTIARSIRSQLGDPNDLAFALMFPVAFALAALTVRGESFGRRVLWLAALVLICWAVIATKSRGGLLATMAVIGCVYAVNFKAKLMPLIVAAALGAMFYVVAGIGEREYSIGAASAIDDSSMTRMDAWRAAFLMAVDRPIFGVGIGNFPDRYWLYAQHWLGRSYVTHSIWFQALSETGFVGLGLLVGMFVAATKSAYRSMRVLERAQAPANVLALGVAVFAAWIGIAVAGSFLSQIFGWQIFTLVALTAVLGQHVAQTYPAEAIAVGLVASKVDQDTAGPASPIRRPVP